jgi:uncharacterized protein with HEPN domain
MYCPDVPWREIARLRDLLAHHYYRVDAQRIRRTVEAPVDQLSTAVGQMLAMEQPDADHSASDGGEVN